MFKNCSKFQYYTPSSFDLMRAVYELFDNPSNRMWAFDKSVNLLMDIARGHLVGD